MKRKKSEATGFVSETPDERMMHLIETGFYAYAGEKLIDCVNAIEDTTIRLELLTRFKKELQAERKRELRRLK